MNKLAIITTLALCACLALGFAAFADEQHHDSGSGSPVVSPEGLPRPAAKSADPSVAYPLDICIVTGEKLGSMGDPIIYDYKGREIRFCCSACISDFEATPDEYLAQIDAKIIEQQSATYPLEVCPVSGAGLGEMGGADDFVINNRLIRLCCAGCEAEIESDPAAYIAQVDEAIKAAQADSYPLTTCVVTGEALPENPVEIVYAGKLVRFCCAGCISDFMKNPGKYMGQLS